MKTKKRNFSPAQLAAQARFAKAAKAGTLKRKKRNTTIIKARKISHLDVSKVHNGLAATKKRKPATKRNAEHKDAQHPIHVRDYWQGRRGYKSQWQRAHEAGQRQLFGVKNPALTRAQVEELVKLTRNLPSYARAAASWANYESLKDSAAALSVDGRKQIHKAKKLAYTANRIYERQMRALEKKYNKGLKAKTNPRRGTRAIGLSAKRFARQSSTLQGKAPSAIYTAEGRRLRKQYLLAETRFHRLKDSMRTIGIKYGASSPQWYKAHENATKAGEHLAKVQQKYFDYGEKAKSMKANPRRGTRKLKGTIKRVERQRGGPYTAEQKRKFSAGFRAGKRELLGAAKSKNGKRLVSAVARRRNGANTSLAKQRRSEFVGRPSTQMKTLYAPAGSGAKGTLAQLGKLHKISVKGGKVYNFKGVPTLAQHPKTDQLFVLGKNYTVNVPKKNPGDRLVDLGEVTRIEYEAVKTHLGDTKPVTYYHHFGEEGGKRPHALVNEEGLIIFSGGDYYIRPEGIRD